MAAEKKDQKTPEEKKPAEQGKPKGPSRPPAVPMNTSYRFAVQREDPIHDKKEETTTEEKPESEETDSTEK